MYPLFTALIGAILTAAGVYAAPQGPSQETSIAIDHVTVISVETGVRFEDHTVVIDGYRISDVGRSGSVQIPAGARLIDGRNKFLIPGLWDMHIHALLMPSRTLSLLVAGGITGIRDMGSSFAAVREARDSGDYRTADRSLHRELQGPVEAGLTPLDALRTATLNPAILFNRTHQLGGIDRGKFADLLLLDADPLVNIANTTRISTVIANGRLVDAAERQSIIDKEMSLRRAEQPVRR